MDNNKAEIEQLTKEFKLRTDEYDKSLKYYSDKIWGLKDEKAKLQARVGELEGVIEYVKKDMPNAECNICMIEQENTRVHLKNQNLEKCAKGLETENTKLQAEVGELRRKLNEK